MSVFGNAPSYLLKCRLCESSSSSNDNDYHICLHSKYLLSVQIFRPNKSHQSWKVCYKCEHQGQKITKPDELKRYNPELLDKDKLVAISKSDMLDHELKAEMKEALDKDFEGIPYLFFSSMAQQGLMELKDKLWAMLNETSVH